VISKRLIKKKNHVTYIRSEKEILTKIAHPFIVNLKFAFASEKKIFLVFESLLLTLLLVGDGFSWWGRAFSPSTEARFNPRKSQISWR
jgi:serine/threonine protein kinase